MQQIQGRPGRPSGLAPVRQPRSDAARAPGRRLAGRLGAGLCAIALAFGALPAAPALAAPSQVQLLDVVVAVVNDEVITYNELKARLVQVQRQLKARNTPLPPEDVLQRQVLERMVTERVQAQAARESGIRVDETTLDRAIGRIAEQNRMTLTQFRDRLEKEGMVYSVFRGDIRNEILMSRVRDREVDSKIQVSDSEIDAWLEAQRSNPTPVELDIAQILVRVPENANQVQQAQRQQRAAEVLKRLTDGADFAQVAAAYSDGFEATRGGDMGWRTADRYPQLFVDAVAQLQPGQVSAIVRSPNGYHVLKLLGRRNDQSIDDKVSQTHARHILLRTNDGTLSDAEAEKRLADLRTRIEAGASDFAEMAKRYSRDGSAAQGGDLGWLYQGDTVPEFEGVMNQLQPGQISPPIQSPFGWHLIQVLERRQVEAPPERKRQTARAAIRERKAEEAYDDWVREQRDRAYVEIRLDAVN
ncbi:peptidylprolyl isomerase [Derxia gummosa]|uniref:Chaperone SurA n=1 Tax=Derxia gummosa DSM 723 TaxID=1121388 RepID=A0A8B6XBE7_9BURK|nr:peptidylprolyl isomerase [Derxia gummosa]